MKVTVEIRPEKEKWYTETTRLGYLDYKVLNIGIEIEMKDAFGNIVSVSPEKFYRMFGNVPGRCKP